MVALVLVVRLLVVVFGGSGVVRRVVGVVAGLVIVVTAVVIRRVVVGRVLMLLVFGLVTVEITVPRVLLVFRVLDVVLRDVVGFRVTVVIRGEVGVGTRLVVLLESVTTLVVTTVGRAVAVVRRRVVVEAGLV